MFSTTVHHARRPHACPRPVPVTPALSGMPRSSLVRTPLASIIAIGGLNRPVEVASQRLKTRVVSRIMWHGLDRQAALMLAGMFEMDEQVAIGEAVDGALRPFDQGDAVSRGQVVVEPERIEFIRPGETIEIEVIEANRFTVAGSPIVFVDQAEGWAMDDAVNGEAAGDALSQPRLARPQITMEQDNISSPEPPAEVLADLAGLLLTGAQKAQLVLTHRISGSSIRSR